LIACKRAASFCWRRLRFCYDGNDNNGDIDGLAWLPIAQVVLAIEEEFALEIPDAEADKMASVADAVAFICAHPMAK
jgi:hypothetical protein